MPTLTWWGRAVQVLGREGSVYGRVGQRRAFDFNHRHVDLSASVEALAPDALAVAVQRNRESGRFGQFFRVRVEFDLAARLSCDPERSHSRRTKKRVQIN